MPRRSIAKQEPPPPQALVHLRDAIAGGGDWFGALLTAIASWEASEEVVDGRRFQYLIAGEAFDWLLLAERLCDALDGAIPAGEREALLFFGRPPRELAEDEFRRAIGDEKHRAHLNFIYGIAVEEALRLGREENRELLVIASVTGTEEDPQSLSRATSTLERAGVIVCNSNSAAARLSGLLVSGDRGG